MDSPLPNIQTEARMTGTATTAAIMAAAGKAAAGTAEGFSIMASFAC